MKEDTSNAKVETKDAPKSPVNTKAKAKATPKKKGTAVARKATKKKEAKKNLKSMKAKKPTKDVKDVKAMRTLCNKVLTSPAGRKTGISLVENAHGAIQVKRADGLLFTFRNCGKGCIITHPIFEDKAKKKRFMKHSGEKWNHLTDCRWSDVTLKMLMDRVNDPKSGKEYYNSFYKGKKKELSGLFQKSEMARVRAEKMKKELAKTKTKKKREKSKTKKASNVVKRQSKKVKKTVKAEPKISPVIAKVAESVS